MNKVALLLGLGGLLMLALLVLNHALRHTKALQSIVAAGFIVASVLTYWQWGSWSQWQDFKQQEAKQEKIRALLATIKSPEDLARKLKRQLDNSPQSAHGWYLLGRLYASQGQWQKAYTAFAKARALNSDDEAIILNYVQSGWQLHEQQLTEEGSKMLHALLQKNPHQMDALALLAANAYKQGEVKQALFYWQRLLKQVTPQSQEARSLRQMIAKAQNQLLLRSEQ